MLKTLAAALAAFAAVILPAEAADTEVDLELVLAVDVSRSMDADEQDLQRQGYIDGIRHPEVLGAIRTGLTGQIAVTYVEWAGPGSQEIVVPWTLIDGEASAAAFGERLRGTSISRLRGTSISGALGFAGGLFDGNGFQGMRQVVDVSGDGPNNMGLPVLESRDAILDRGITVNGLPIMLKARFDGAFSIEHLDEYYENCVIGGPGAFLITVTSPERFAEAIRRKLVLEIAGQPARIVPASMHERAPAVDCLIGERMRRSWMRE